MAFSSVPFMINTDCACIPSAKEGYMSESKSHVCRSLQARQEANVVVG